MQAGSTYTINAQASNIAWAAYASNHMSVWIDYGNNNSFSDAEKVVGIIPTEVMANSNIYPNAQFTIPANLESGSYRMRVKHEWLSNGDSSDPCKDTGEGETEDYTIIVKLPVAWVDFTRQNAGTGTQANPFNTLADAISAVSSGGEIKIIAGTTNETPTLTKPMTITPPNGGTCVIGRQ